MDPYLKKFIGRILIAALFMGILGWVVFSFLLPGRFLPVLPWMLAFFTLIAVLTHAYQLKLSRKDLGRFTRSSMIISMLRLMLYSFFAIFYLAANPDDAAVFVVSLVFIYSVYTIIEIAEMTRILRRKK